MKTLPWRDAMVGHTSKTASPREAMRTNSIADEGDKTLVGFRDAASRIVYVLSCTSSPWIIMTLITSDVVMPLSAISATLLKTLTPSQLLPPFQNIRCFSFVKQMYLDIF
jgi:hypothetical protein